MLEMAATDDAADVLEQRFAKLLRISVDDNRDYLNTILESLSQFSDPEDIAEYLSSFVPVDDDGTTGEVPDLHQFARDVNRFNAGEEISVTTNVSQNNEKPAAVANEAKPKRNGDPLANQRKETKRRELEARQMQRNKQVRPKQRPDKENRNRARLKAAPEKATSKGKKASSSVATGASGQRNVSEDVKHPTQLGAKTNRPLDVAPNENKVPRNHTAKAQQQKSHKRGKPKATCCGCYGSKHEPLTNCLRCGRISCAVEGLNDFCHFCGFFIEDPLARVAASSGRNDSALRHTERLLEFDKTCAARTHIHDDQEDYFTASSSVWATEREQEEAKELEEKRRRKLHDRQNQVLDINF